MGYNQYCPWEILKNTHGDLYEGVHYVIVRYSNTPKLIHGFADSLGAKYNDVKIIYFSVCFFSVPVTEDERK